MATRTKLAGYNVYYSPEGCDEEFCGFATTLASAKKMRKSNRLPKSLYATAQAAGHCGGLTAPDTSREIEDHITWLDGEFCAVGVAADADQ